MNLLWYLKGTQLKTSRRENKSSETFTESGKRRIHLNESSTFRWRNTSTSEWFQLSRPASRMKKASQTRCLTFAPYAWRRFTPWGVMRCGRGLRTTHYIVLPRLTVLGLGTAWAIRVVIPSTNSPMTLQRYAVFLNLQNSHKTAGTLWVFHLWNLPFCIVLVYIFIYIVQI